MKLITDNWSPILFFYCSVVSDSLQIHGLLHTRLPHPLPSRGACWNSLSLPIESVMPSKHLILYHPLLLLPSIFPRIRVCSKEPALLIRWLKYGASASASVLPMNIQDLFHLGWTSLISLQSKGLSRVFSNTTVQKYQYFGPQVLYSLTFTPIHDY